jgi:DNA polymerase-3 subunit delta'
VTPGKWVRETRSAAARPVASDDADGVLRLRAPLGQGAALTRWSALARRGALPHAFVVSGARGAGKSVVIEWLTAALLCPSDLDPESPCGVCRTCTRIANGLHPDVHLVDRARDEADRDEWKKSFYVIKVDQVRAAQQTLARHAVEGRARVLVIADADRLDEAAQNALLKTLEEPGERTFLLLEATRPENLLPTIHSRAQRLGVLPLADDLVRRELSARVPDRSPHHEIAVQLAGGSLGAALAACTEQVVQIHHLVREALAQPDRLRPVDLARKALAGARGRHLEIEAAQRFLWLLRRALQAEMRALAEAGDGAYPAARSHPWMSWLERTLAAERDLDLLIPAEQALTACLASFSTT